MMRRCQSCGASVLWLRNERTLHPAPIEPRGAHNGNLVIDETAGTYRLVKAGEGDHASHFATCPEAAAWRR